MKLFNLLVLVVLINILSQAEASAQVISCSVNATIIPQDETKTTCLLEEGPGLFWTEYKQVFNWSYYSKTCGTEMSIGNSGASSADYLYDSPYTDTHTLASRHWWQCWYYEGDEPFPDLYVRQNYAISYRVYVKTSMAPNTWSSFAHIQTSTPNLDWYDYWIAT